MQQAQVRVLIVDDNPSDAELLERELRRGGLNAATSRVETEQDYLAALQDKFDIVLCDWKLPQFDSLRALAILKEQQLDIPFILVSGLIGEEAAVQVIKQGAADYLVKDRLARLVPAVQQAISNRALQQKAQRDAAALRESEALLAEAQNIARLGSWSWEPNKNKIWWSTSMFNLFGIDRSAGPPTYDTFMSLIHPEDRMAAVARFESVISGAEGFSSDLRFIRHDGQQLWIHSHACATRDSSGNLIRLQGTDQDITEQKRIEVALRESEERYRLAIRATDDAVWDYDMATGTVRWSERYTTLFNRPPETANSFDWWSQQIHEADREKAVASFQTAVAGQGDHWECEYRFRRADGEWADIVDRAYISRDATGSARRVVGAMQDVTARKLAAAKLHKTNEFLAALTEGATDAVFVKDRTGKYLLFNNAAAEFVGISPDKVLGNDDTMIFSASDAASIMANDRLAMESGQSHTREETLTVKGVPRVFMATKSPYRDEHGNVIGVIGISRDITAWKQAELAVRENEERYRRLVDVLPNAVFIKAGEKITFCNPSCLQLFGATDPSQIIGKNPFDLFHPDYHAIIRKRVDEMRTSGNPVPSIEKKIVRLDGRIIPVHVVATPISEGGEDAVLVAISDLTERERSMELLRSVLRSVTDSILTINANGIIQSANPANELLFGYSEQELIGKNVKILMPEPHRSQHDDYIANFLKTGVGKIIGVGREVIAQRKDGTTFPVELTVAQFRLDGELHFTGVIRDISSRKRLENQFHQAQKMEAIGQLAGGVAHDFNNMLTVINGYTEIVLSELPAGDPNAVHLESVMEVGERAAALTAQLLAFSRKSFMEPKVLDLNVLIEHIGAMLKRLIGEDIKFSTVLAPDLKHVKADPGQLEQVLVNLVVNARDAMPAGGKLTIETENVVHDSDDVWVVNGGTLDSVRLRVRDTGIGIPREIQSRIFEPFFTTKEVLKGTGLGLSTVYGIVKHSNGMIEVDSTVGEGSTFTVTLPAVDEEILREKHTTPERMEAPRGTETIVLVEDEEHVLQFVRSVLESSGFTVLAASTGTEALAKAKAHSSSIQLLLTDVIMPRVSGRELAEEFRSAWPKVRVLYMSGYTGDEIVRYGVETAADAFLQKPFSPLELLRKVRDTLDRI